MKKIITILSLFVALFMNSCSPKNQQIVISDSKVSSDWINVKDFGAKGDGKTDDTDAIKKAFAAVEKLKTSIKHIPEIYEKGPYFGGTKRIYFPHGKYIISDELRLGAYINLEGDKAILLPSVSFKKSDKFAIRAHAWQARIRGVQFIGFSKALKIDNQNNNSGKIIIEDCDFINNQIAIDLNAQSTITSIRENRFHHNQKVLIMHTGDKVIFSENWVQSGVLTGTHDAQIINKNGELIVQNCLLVPMPPALGTVEPAWINNHRHLIVTGTRAGGEAGSRTLINNFAEADLKYPVIPRTVTIRDSHCYGIYGSTKDYRQPAVLRLIAIPNQICIDNVRGMTNSKLVDFSRIKQMKDEKIMMKKHKGKISIRIDNIVGENIDKNRSGNYIPKELIFFLEKQKN